jgi:hypothetical protein
MRRLISGQHPRVNWNRCKKRARSRYERQTNGLISSSIPVPNRCNQSRRKVMKPLKPVRQMTPRAAKRDRQATEPYLQIIENGISSVRDATRLRDFGILLPGTRVAATNLLAWHFVFACKMSEQQAVAELVDWVYRTGKRTSTTVVNDLSTGRRNAEEQTRQILHWMVIQSDLLPISVPLQVRESGSSCLAVFSRCERSERLLNTACRECGGGHVIQRTMPAVVVVVKTPTVNHVAGFLQA